MYILREFKDVKERSSKWELLWGKGTISRAQEGM